MKLIEKIRPQSTSPINCNSTNGEEVIREISGSVREKKPDDNSSISINETTMKDESNATGEISDKQENVTFDEVQENVETEKIESIKEPKPERKTVCISKIGSDHIFANKNNHDFAFKLLNMKIVIDGCGSGKHSEVGTRIFAQLFARKAKEYFEKNEAISEENFIDVVNSIFEKMLELCDDISFIFQNYCFTILVCFENEDEFVVYSCGDGYIIKENSEGISFDKLDDGEYPCYYIYNFITDKTALVEYQDGVDFKEFHFSKAEYSNIGVSTDGLRFSENLLEVEKNKLMKFLHEGKGPQIEVLINRNSQKFHDDISICF